MTSYPSRRHPGTAPIGQPRPTTGEQQFVAAWLGHVVAGRIGSHLDGPTASLLEARPTQMSPEQLAMLRANELAVLGHAPSFAPPPASGLAGER